MRSALKPTWREDEVDRLVDTLLAEPDRVDDIKSMLRRKLNTERIVPLKSAPATANDIDDMWDNVPV